MEKVKVKTAIDSGKKFNDKPIINIELEDGRKGAAFTPEALQWKGEIELEVKEGKEYEGKKQYTFSLPKTQQTNGKFPAKDYTFEKRKASYEFAIETAKVLEVKVKDTASLTKVAESIYEYLNKK